jgi:hypothetical protein
MTYSSLSPAAQAVLTALTQQEYGLDPADIPNEAGRMACVAAAALRAAVTFTRKEKIMKTLGVTMAKSQAYCLESDLLAIAAELEAQ